MNQWTQTTIVCCIGLFYTPEVLYCHILMVYGDSLPAVFISLLTKVLLHVKWEIDGCLDSETAKHRFVSWLISLIKNPTFFKVVLKVKTNTQYRMYA